jgi:hypothetical protein
VTSEAPASPHETTGESAKTFVVERGDGRAVLDDDETDEREEAANEEEGVDLFAPV